MFELMGRRPLQGYLCFGIVCISTKRYRTTRNLEEEENYIFSRTTEPELYPSIIYLAKKQPSQVAFQDIMADSAYICEEHIAI